MPLGGRDPHVRDLSAWEAEQVTIGYGDDVAGRGTLSNKIARLVSRAMRDAKDAGLGRTAIAQKMSEILGRPVGAASLDKWASEAAEEHRIPLDAFVSLIDATAQHKLLGFLPEIFGYAVVPARYVDMIELQQLQEHKEAVAAREAKRRDGTVAGRGHAGRSARTITSDEGPRQLTPWTPQARPSPDTPVAQPASAGAQGLDHQRMLTPVSDRARDRLAGSFGDMSELDGKPAPVPAPSSVEENMKRWEEGWKEGSKNPTTGPTNALLDGAVDRRRVYREDETQEKPDVRGGDNDFDLQGTRARLANRWAQNMYRREGAENDTFEEHKKAGPEAWRRARLRTSPDEFTPTRELSLDEIRKFRGPEPASPSVADPVRAQRWQSGPVVAPSEVEKGRQRRLPDPNDPGASSPRFADPQKLEVRMRGGGAEGGGSGGTTTMASHSPVVQHFHGGFDAAEAARRSTLERNREVRRSQARALHTIGRATG